MNLNQENNIMKLRPLEEKDAKRMFEWMSDPEVNQFFRFDKTNLSIEKCRAFIATSFTDTDHHYAIEENGEYVGTISLKHINQTNKNAEYAIALHKDAQGKGLGTQASRELLKIAFNDLSLNKVYLDVLSDNSSAIHLYKKLGFKEEGELKQHVFINKEFHNLKLFGILKEDYERM